MYLHLSSKVLKHSLLMNFPCFLFLIVMKESLLLLSFGKMHFFPFCLGNMKTGAKEGKILGSHKAGEGSKSHQGHVLCLSISTDSKFLVSSLAGHHNLVPLLLS